MSQVIRYTTTGTAFGPALTDCPNGLWVSYADYYYLSAENERLRKAGDAFIGTYLFASAKGLVSQDTAAKVIQDWQAAKQGDETK